MGQASTSESLFPGKLRRYAPKKAAPEPRAWSPLAVGAVVLCIDPSISDCGWAIIRNDHPNPTRLDSGIFHPVTREDLNRYDHLSKLIVQRVELFDESTATAAGDASKLTDALIEIPTGGGGWGSKTTGTLMLYTRAIGVCEATCRMLALRMHRVCVSEWKGQGKKSRTGLFVRHAFKYDPRDDNEADALGLGLWLCGKTGRPVP